MVNSVEDEMRVLYVRNADIEKDRFTISQIETIKALRKQNIDARLIINGRIKSDKPYLIIKKKPFQKNRYYRIKMLFYLPYYVLKNKINFLVIDEYSVISAIIMILLKNIFHKYVILDVRTIPLQDINIPLNRRISYKIAKILCDGAIFITEGTKKVCEENYDLKFRKTEIITSAANEKLFNKDIQININQNIIDKLKNKFVILYHGSISINHGVTLIMDSVNKLKYKIPNLLFLSISNNNELLKNYCVEKKLELDGYVLFLDAQDNSIIPQYIKLADIGIIPLLRLKWWEVSSPLKLMEYLSMELPMVLSDIEAHTTVVPRNSDFVIYFNPDTENELDKKILSAYNNLEELKKNSWKGRSIVIENYTWSRLANKLINYFNSFNVEQIN